MTSPDHETQQAHSMSHNAKTSLSVLVGQIAQDLSELTRSELALAKAEIEHTLRKAGMSVAASLLGATVALIGLAMLCATAVVAIAPLIPSLWLRMLCVSVIYLLFGSLFALVFLLQLRRAVANVSAPRAMREARETLTAVTREVKHG